MLSGFRGWKIGDEGRGSRRRTTLAGIGRRKIAMRSISAVLVQGLVFLVFVLPR